MTSLAWLYCIMLVPVSGSRAQGFTVPPTWRKPFSTYTRQDLLPLVTGVLNTIDRSLNATDGQFFGLMSLQSASMVSALSIGDALNGSRTSEDTVSNSLDAVFRLSQNDTNLRTPPWETNDDPAIWGLAALDAYKAYDNPRFLGYAVSMWTGLREYMITPNRATSSPTAHPKRAVPFHGVCNGISNAGSIFFLNGNSTDTRVDGQSTAAFMAMSAYLYKRSKDAQYLAAAELSADFLLEQLSNGNVILDSMNLANCSKSTILWTSGSAYTIYGLRTYVTNQPTSPGSLSQLLSTVVPNQRWTNQSDGINIEGPSDAKSALLNGPHVALKGVFIRSLYQAFTRLESSSPEAGLIRSYINVQLNALLDLASTPGTNEYSPRWEGPPPSRLLPQGQLAAVDLLYSSLDLLGVENTTSAGGSTGVTNSASLASASGTESSVPLHTSTSTHHLSSGAVGGIVVGLVIFGSGVTLLICVIRRRGRPQARNHTPAGLNTAAARVPAGGISHPEASTYGPLSSIMPPSSVGESVSISCPEKAAMLAANPTMASYLFRPGSGEWGYTAGRELRSELIGNNAEQRSST